MKAGRARLPRPAKESQQKIDLEHDHGKLQFLGGSKSDHWNNTLAFLEVCARGKADVNGSLIHSPEVLEIESVDLRKSPPSTSRSSRSNSSGSCARQSSGLLRYAVFRPSGP